MPTKKAQFFRKNLVPAGQVTEVLLSRLSDYRQQAIAHLIFEPLNLVACFAVSPKTPVNDPVFAKLGGFVDNFTNELREILKPIIAGEKLTTAQSTEFRKNTTNLEERLKPFLSMLEATIGYAPAAHALWLENLLEQATPLTVGKSYNKWRTLVRNMDFKENMGRLGLGELAKSLNLGSDQGKAALAELWSDTFHTNVVLVNDVKMKTDAVLPSAIKVKSDATGMLEVTATYNTARHVPRIAGYKPEVYTAELNELLKEEQYRVVCEYRNLSATVEEAKAWLAGRMAAAPKIVAEYNAMHESFRIEQVRKKMESTFTPEELELLSKVTPAIAKATKAMAAPNAKATPTKSRRKPA